MWASSHSPDVPACDAHAVSIQATRLAPGLTNPRLKLQRNLETDPGIAGLERERKFHGATDGANLSLLADLLLRLGNRPARGTTGPTIDGVGALTWAQAWADREQIHWPDLLCLQFRCLFLASSKLAHECPYLVVTASIHFFSASAWAWASLGE